MEIWEIVANSVKNISLLSVLDILVVAYIFYKGYVLIKETRAEQLLKGILFIIALIPISYLLELRMVYAILNKTITIGVLSIIIIFQPEIRRALEHLGRSAFLDKHILADDNAIEDVVSEIVIAIEDLAETKTGVLLAIEQNTGLGEVISNGTKLDAVVSSALLGNIFVVNTPLHDGATIIRNDRIIASGCVLPLTSNTSINKKLGTRHRAAMGLSEVSDALIIVVSEETGTVSLAVNGKLRRNFTKEELKLELLKLIKSQKDSKKITAKERIKKWITKNRKKTS
ncbi:diadenylate cyclase CdaA [Clostridium frigidicarnis]|uniref:Diadenylate cyclase n=1 Tax=Clostridium frigidicarnis TaxID=84698 RepID=A0A1I0Z5C1_9CLOT|nr:diadenylate cyclase CdaA [Clostridium frigidicarnis]SFB20602.1 diadenylate cyclase [Clostridium frigidicarnis]